MKDKIFTLIDYKTFLKNKIMLELTERFKNLTEDELADSPVLSIDEILEPESAKKVIEAYQTIREFESLLGGEGDEEE